MAPLHHQACPRFTALETDGICKMMLRNLAQDEPTDSRTRGDAAGSAHVSALNTVLIEEFDAASIREGDKVRIFRAPNSPRRWSCSACAG